MKLNLGKTTFYILLNFFAGIAVFVGAIFQQSNTFCLSRSNLVRSRVEAGEEVKVEGRLNKDIVGEEDGIADVVQGKVDAVRSKKDELDDLQLGDVPFPPQVLLHVWAKSGQAVVSVHDLIVLEKQI